MGSSTEVLSSLPRVLKIGFVGRVIRSDAQAATYCGMGRENFRSWALRNKLRPEIKAQERAQNIYSVEELDLIMDQEVADCKAGKLRLRQR